MCPRTSWPRARRAAIRGYMAYGPPGVATVLRRQSAARDRADRIVAAQFRRLPVQGDRAACSPPAMRPPSCSIPTVRPCRPRCWSRPRRCSARPGDRAVLGPSTDGGYYLLGIKQAHRRLFDDIDWSTERVARQTLERAREIGLDVHRLPAWYDVDDSQALRQLHAELFEGGSLDPALTPFHAPNTAALMNDLLATADLGTQARAGAQGVRKARVMTATATGQARRPAALFRERRCQAQPDGGAAAGLRLSRDHQPLQSPLHDLPAHLCRARAAGRHELGAVHLDRRPDPESRTRGAARRRRADAGEEPAEDGALPEGSRHLCAVQHQRHGAQRQERPRADRRRPRRAAGLARRRQRGIVPRHPRRRFLQPHPAQCAPLPRAAGARGSRAPARLGLAHRPQGDDRRAAGVRAGRRRHRRQRGLSPAPGLFRERRHRQCAARPGACSSR